MNDEVGSWDVRLVVRYDAGEKLPLGGRHGALHQMVFGVNMVGHDEAGVDDDRGFL